MIRRELPSVIKLLEIRQDINDDKRMTSAELLAIKKRLSLPSTQEEWEEAGNPINKSGARVYVDGIGYSKPRKGTIVCVPPGGKSATVIVDGMGGMAINVDVSQLLA